MRYVWFYMHKKEPIYGEWRSASDYPIWEAEFNAKVLEDFEYYIEYKEE